MPFLRTLLVERPVTALPTNVAAWFQGAGRDKLWDRVSLCLLVVALGLVLATFRDYGITWDEDAHNRYGELVLAYYFSLFKDLHALDLEDLYHYGAAFDMTAALLNRVSPLGVFETRHLLNGLVGILGLGGCWRLGRALGGPRAGCIATLFLLLTPNYYGQMFNNPKDIPFAAGAVWSTYFLVRVLPSLPRPPLALLIKLGVAIGLTMGVRIGGLLFLCYAGLVLLLDAVWQGLAARRAATTAAAGRANLLYVFLPVALVAYPVTLLFWPYGQLDPIGNPLEALAFFSHQEFPYSTLFAGRFVPAEDLPWTYLPTYIAIALPELVLVLLLTAPLMAAAALRRGRTALSRHGVLGHFLLAFGIVFPVLYAIAIRAVLFDGMRHFIFVLPLIAVAAALVGDRLIARLEDFRYRRSVYAALALYGAAHVTIMARLHPDQYVYYNAFVGGVEGAQGEFKLDYWANSYAEAVRGLVTYLRREYGAGFDKRQFSVAVCGPALSADYYFPANFRFAKDPIHADFFVAFTKDNCDRSLPGLPIYKVERMGALLSVVLDRRAILARQHGRVGTLIDRPAQPLPTPPQPPRGPGRVS